MNFSEGDVLLPVTGFMGRFFLLYEVVGQDIVAGQLLVKIQPQEIKISTVTISTDYMKLFFF